MRLGGIPQMILAGPTMVASSPGRLSQVRQVTDLKLPLRYHNIRICLPKVLASYANLKER